MRAPIGSHARSVTLSRATALILKPLPVFIVSLALTLPVRLDLVPTEHASKGSANETTQKAAAMRFADRDNGARDRRGVVHGRPFFALLRIASNAESNVFSGSSSSAHIFVRCSQGSVLAAESRTGP